tara:strand:+ start:131 stop:298 length:168 start_codon:yes stop_codon:yes gene_type:complete
MKGLGLDFYPVFFSTAVFANISMPGVAANILLFLWLQLLPGWGSISQQYEKVLIY